MFARCSGVVFSLALFACSSESPTDASRADAGDDAADDAADSGEPPGVNLDWAVPVTCPTDSATSCGSFFDTALAASDLGVDRFVAIEARWLLAERSGDAGVEAVVFELPGAKPVLLPTTPGIEPRALGGGAVLLCDGAACSAYEHPDPSAPSFVLIPGGPVPAAFEPTGMIRDGAGALCAFGNGVTCLESGAWTERLAPGGPRLRAAAVTGDTLWLAGEAGRAVRIDAGGASEVPSGTNATLTAVGASKHGVLFGAADGTIHGSGVDFSLTCSLGADPVLGVWLSEPGTWFDVALVTASGRTFRGPYTWCRSDPIGGDTLVDTGGGCNGSGGWSVSQHTAYVSKTCPVQR